MPTLLALQTDGKWKALSMSLQPAATDDRGRYRIAGLPPGKYAIQAALPTMQTAAGVGPGSLSMHMNPGDALVAYSGNVLRERDLKPVEVGSGDEVGGIDIVFPLSGLHTVAGSVVAKFDNHALNRGTIVLLDPDTKTAMRTAFIDSEGAFRLNYVPDGTYVLKLTGAADTETNGGAEAMDSDFARLLNAKIVKSYGDVEQTITVKTDLPSITLQAPERPKNSAAATPPA